MFLFELIIWNKRICRAEDFWSELKFEMKNQGAYKENLRSCPEEYLQPSRTSMMELFLQKQLMVKTT